MKSLERAIAAISPRWAAERAYYRSVLEMDGARAYNAARNDRRTDGWFAPASGPNTEIGAAVNRIRQRARDLVRNNPYAAGYPALMASKIVGSGIYPRLALSGDDNKPARDRARGIWDRFADNCDPERLTDFYGLENLVARTVAESGEAIIRTVRLPSNLKAPFPLQIVVQEGDYLDSNRTYEAENGNVIIQGVEFNQWGHRVAYWLFDEHPGESLVRFTRVQPASRRVDAADIDHVFERLRPGQVRGVSPFASVALKLRDLDDFDDAELMRKKVAACFAAFVKRPQGNTVSPLTPSEKVSTGANGSRIERLNPAMIKYLEPGEEIEFGEPPSADGYTEYHFGQLYAVAAGLNCTFEQLTGNLKGVNFSSMRIGENRFQDLLDHLQDHIYIPQVCRKAWTRVGQVARITGELGINDPWQPAWIKPRRRWLDPATDVKAATDAARALLRSPLDVIAEQGEDPEQVIEEVSEFNRILDAKGIISDIDPRRVGRTSTAAPAKVPSDPNTPASEAA